MTDQTPTPTIVPPPGKLIWTRWWMILIYVIVGLGFLGALLPSDDDEGDTIAAPATTVEGATTTTAEDATTTTAPKSLRPRFQQQPQPPNRRQQLLRGR